MFHEEARVCSYGCNHNAVTVPLVARRLAIFQPRWDACIPGKSLLFCLCELDSDGSLLFAVLVDVPSHVVSAKVPDHKLSSGDSNPSP